MNDGDMTVSSINSKHFGQIRIYATIEQFTETSLNFGVNDHYGKVQLAASGSQAHRISHP